jgi:phenylpropionate dioxygenase-like ring-hydroxylating dioxygenase large terminal subunit
MALSGGTVKRGVITCPYHGWRFDGRGSCVGVPCALPAEPTTSRRVAAFAAHESDGTIWVHAGNGDPPPAPSWPGELSSYEWFEVVTVLDCPLLWVINNFVDCAHTGVVHKGLFRGAPHRRVRAEIAETDSGVRIETFGETDPSSLLAALLVPRGETLSHVDEVILPSTVRVDYRFGAERHIVTVSISTPETEERTRIVTRVGVHMPPVSRAVLPIVARTTRKILAQDKLILEAQASRIRRFGRDFAASTAADAPTAWVTRAFDAMLAGAFPPAELRSKTVEYLL